MATETARRAGIVDYARAHYAPPARADEPRGRDRRSKTGIYVNGAEMIVTPDGYERRSPVQPVRTAPDYYRRIARRVVGAVLVCALAVLAVYLLLHYKIISI